MTFPNLSDAFQYAPVPLGQVAETRRAFSGHNIRYEIEVSAADLCEALEICALEFRRCNLTVASVRSNKAGLVRFHLLDEHEADLSPLHDLFRTNLRLKLTSWVTNVGQLKKTS